MERYTFTRRALGAMPNTPDDVVFLAAVIVAFLSGALLIDWIRRFRDLGKQKHWHDTQMKALEKGSGSSEHLLGSLAAIQSSLIGLHEKADDASARIDYNNNNRINELRQALDHIPKHQQQDFDIKQPSPVQPMVAISAQDLRELLVSVRTLQDTLNSNDYNTSAAPQPSSTVPTNKINPDFPDVRTTSAHPELPPVLQVESSHLRSQCDALNAENMDLKQRLEAAQGIHAEIEENTKDAADKYWKKLLDDELRWNAIQKNSLQQIQDDMTDLLKQNDELAFTNAEMGEVIELVENSAEDSQVELQELHRLLAEKNLAQKYLEEDIENQLSEAEDLNARLSLAEKERTKAEEEIKDLVNLHERAQLSAMRKDAKIDELNERLAAEASQLTRISTERDILTKENEAMSAQMRALEEENLRDKRQIDSLTKESDEANEQKNSLEREHEERHKTGERQKEAPEHDEDVHDGSFSDPSKQTKASEPHPNKRTISPIRSLTSATTPNEELVQEPTQDPRTESTAAVTMPPITPGGKNSERHADANEQHEKAVEDAISSVELPVLSSTRDGEQVVQKRDWAEDDTDADLSTGEVESFIAKASLLPTTASLEDPSIQRMPESPAGEPRRALDDNQNKDMSDPNVSNSEPEASPATSPATPGFIMAACRKCNADVLVETFIQHDGTQQPNWRKHLKQVHGKEKTPHQSVQSPGSANSIA